MSGRTIPAILGKGQRFPGFGSPPTPWSFNSALEISWHLWVCHFTCWFRIKVEFCLPSWYHLILISSSCILQFSSVPQSCLTLCDPMACSTSVFPVHHQLLEFTQTHVHWVGDAIQPSYYLSSPFPPAFNLSQHQGLFQWVSSLHQVAKVLEFQLQHQSFQWIFRTDFL